ncbi:uncharacterized protein LOC117644221 [Thrips palmi]|uniref:ATP-dependent DNA helicase n=1 Tax=Thrips palmi TaxID=161013 RepID=A0A6P8YQ33_THRPL|nr:uncharacterized protein LOC117644221 [Thrips palmi]
MEAISDLVEREDAGEDIMSSQEKLKLVREDPIVCAMMFREIVLQLKKYLRMKNKGPMGQYYMTDWFIRIEFQQRGAPHCHGLLWLNNGPDEPLIDREEAVRFADELLTCDSTHPLAERNSHSHTTTCFRKKSIQRRFRLKKLDPHEAHRHCRFDAPFWPTPRTRILDPLFLDTDERPEDERGDCSWEDYIKSLRELRLRLKDVLSSPSCPDTLEAVWREAGCPDDRSYELAIRTGLKHVKIIYRRTVQDKWTNSYLRWVLDVLGFNSDAQVVLDVYSLVRYCVSYVTKAEKNHSQLHNEITTLRREHAFDDRTLMRMLASKCLRAKETSAQEASWILLNFPLSEMSRKCSFIDTSLPDERHHCPKPKKDIDALPEGATDLWYPDVFDVYANRHDDLENTTLAEFVAVHHQSNNMKPRKKDRIIRYRRFNENGDNKDQRENFYRSMCTLHIPWRNEQDDILSAGAADGGFEGLYERHEPDILPRRARFEGMLGRPDCDMEGELQNVVAEDEAEANEAAEAARRQLAGDGKYVFEEAEFMDAGAQDIDVDLPEPRFNQPRTDPVATVRRRGIWDRDTFLYNIRRLNTKQREVVLAVYDGVRLNSEPMLLYIDGAAGTGKSLVAQCCANAFDTFAAPNDKSSAARVISCAPTGKAACIIGGMTIHHSHKLPYNQEEGATKRMHDGHAPMPPLQGQQLANLQNFFLHVEAQLIDEISMVSARNFLAMDQRSREAKGKESDFGGLWTIVFGDFRQLTPVGGSAVYKSSTTEISGSAALWQKFQYVELTQNMRQGDDKKYAELLAIIGDAETPLSDADCDLIETRFVEKNNLIVPDEVPRIYQYNDDKDRHNNTKLLRAEIRKIFRVIARDRVQTKSTYKDYSRQRREEKAETILQRAEALNVAKAEGLPSELLAVVGRPYKLTYNQDTADHLVNGAVGTLVWVQLGVLSASCLAAGAETALAVHKLWLRFPGNCGALASRAAAGELRLAIQRQNSFPADMVNALPFDLPPSPHGDELHGLVPIERRDLVLRKVWTEKWREVVRQQFPLSPAHADTIHSSQGSGYETACFHYDPGMTNEMVYVAMSRVLSLAGLYMTYSKRSRSLHTTRDGRVTKQKDRRPPRLFVHPKIRPANHPIRREKERLRTKTFRPRWAGLLQRPADSLRAVFHNVQSLRAHHPDVTRDTEVFMAADMLLLAETWLRPEDNVDLGHGMRQVARCDMARAAPGHAAGGVAIY